MDIESLSLFIRGCTVGVLIILSVKLLLHHRTVLAAKLLLILVFALICYSLVPLFSWGWAKHAITSLSFAIPWVFWIFSKSIFSEQEETQGSFCYGVLSFWEMALIALFHLMCIFLYLTIIWEVKHHSLAFNEIIGWIRGEQGSRSTLVPVMFYLSNFLKAFFVIHALYFMVKYWQSDLVENRRKLRALFMASGGLYILLVVFVEVFILDQPALVTLEFMHVLSLGGICSMITVWFVLFEQGELFHASKAPIAVSLGIHPGVEINSDSDSSDDLHKKTSDNLTMTEQAWLNDLMAAVTVEKVYRRSEMTVRILSAMLGIPEHLLRRLINQHLGYRNFNEFINQYRLAEAAQRLSDPDDERVPILTIAYEVGFASIAPFNRSFKSKFDKTPSEYRKSQLNGHNH